MTKTLNQTQYLLIKSKTFSNFINGMPNNISFLKALTVGETKVMNGETYVVKMTPSGVPDWRKVGDPDKDANVIDLETLNHLFDNNDFPNVGDIEVINGVTLGGSTGAVLVKAKGSKATGVKYVMKKGATKEHVEEEFLVNSIYKLMGAGVPEMKIYQTKNSAFILSQFMEDTTPANNVMDDLMKDEMMEHFVLDCLLANWDIYKNDNVLVNDNNGNLVRVDNGGGLRFSAQGRKKGVAFSGTVDELTSMIKNNKDITSRLSQDDINSQIQNILLKREDILDLIEDKDLKDTMTSRLQDLENRIISPLAAPKKKKAVTYKKITDKQLEKIYDSVNGDITKQDQKNGWVFLNEIAKLRGFDGFPEVVEASEFDKLMADKDTHLLHRGLTGVDAVSAPELMKRFTEGECYYGTQGIYGAGIYGAVNLEKGNFSHKNPNYKTALAYADYKPEHIIDILIPKGAKVIDSKDLDDMMAEEFFGKDFAAKKAELDDEVRNLYEMKNKISDFEKKIENDTKKGMGWNEKTYNVLLNSKPEQVYADTDKYQFSKALNYFTVIIESINGKINKIDDHSYEVTLPNSREKFILNSNSAEIALKQKNQFTTPYNFHYQTFKKFVINNHYRGIEAKVKEAITTAKEDSVDIKNFKQSLDDSTKKVDSISKEVNSLKSNGDSTINKVMAKIAGKPNGEYRGFYAAIKGYDAIIQRNAWNEDKTFAVILNRSKMIVKKFD